MLKQILSKLPRKTSKSDTSDSILINNTSGSCNGTSRGNSEGLVSSKSNVVKRTSSAVFPTSVVSGIEPLLAFKDVPASEKMNLFLSKLNLCCMTFDFSDPTKNASEKDMKRQTLIELVDFVASGPPTKIPEPAIFAMSTMCAINLFRVFPPNNGSNFGVGENDDDEPMFDPAWTHLQIVYDLLLKFIISSSLEAKVAKKYMDHSFILRLLDLFESEDPRERECLKTVVHRIYGKFMVHRPFIRKCMSNIFHRFVFETERHSGITELLEIFGSVISGFALPLKEEHKIFLWKSLIPLHKPKSLGVYFQQLSYCVTQFVEKEPKLASTVIKGLLKYWPITNSQKQLMFLGELEEILEATNMFEFQKVMVPLFWRVGCCINSYHFQVAERALFLWNNDQIFHLIGHNRQVILPIVFPSLEKNAQGHWNHSVLNSTLNVRKMFEEMDNVLFQACQAQFREDQGKLSLLAEQRRGTWEQLENVASLQPVAGNIAILVSPPMATMAC
ncbi:hypothetical protein Nepgr_014280 [Nepenthes gracilis]|uniref:Serine/threonine protein phosphatase 2A regulatory subunit n=1 Tax=Nepenthes gracilis TaxID=150966 RepID=A0AAD3SKK4_NEPGR|nr:hypothetical protein Nepgr_014280 [Nepenthes gracilis]